MKRIINQLAWSDPKLFKEHPYISKYLSIVSQTQLTITYNFDDLLERALSLEEERKTGGEKSSRGYETVTNPWTQFSRSTAVIYHPHGFVSKLLMEGPIDKIVFSEKTYADHFVGSMSGDHAGIISHLSKNTCLLIGLSLEDELRNLLVLSAKSSPGNYHYYVHHVKKKERISPQRRNAIRRANFDVYNLITLFLKDDEIAALGELINPQEIEQVEFCELAQQLGLDCAFRFYFTGPLGVGKSTAISNLRSLVVFDEWCDPRHPLMALPADELTPLEKEEVDQFIATQFGIKNENLRRDEVGIFVVDRPPMDPLAFTPPDEIQDKAKMLLKNLCPGKVSWKVEPGTVIRFTGNLDELHQRLLLTKRGKYTAKKLKEMEEKLKKIYSFSVGTELIDTTGLSTSEVTKKVAEIVHLKEYRPANLDSRLKAYSKGVIPGNI